MEGLEARKLLCLRKEYTEEELVEGYRREYERIQRLLRDADDEGARQWNEELERRWMRCWKSLEL